MSPRHEFIEKNVQKKRTGDRVTRRMSLHRKKYSPFLNKIRDLPDSHFKPFRVKIRVVPSPESFLTGVSDRWGMVGEEIWLLNMRKDARSDQR